MHQSLLYPGERAAFAALGWVKAQYRSIQRGEPGHSDVPLDACIAAAMQLTVLADIVLRRGARGVALDGEDVFAQVVELPVFFPVEWVHRWETKRPWAQPPYSVHPALVNAYAQELDEDPSRAYQRHSKASSVVWMAWLQQTDSHDIAAVLKASAARILAWSSCRTQADACQANLSALACLLGEHSNHANALGLQLAYLHMAHKHPQTGALHDLYLAEHGTDVHSLLVLWDEALAFPRGTFAGLFSASCVYVDAALLRLPVWERKTGWRQAWTDALVLEVRALAQQHRALEEVWLAFGRVWVGTQELTKPDEPFVWETVDGIAGVEHALRVGAPQRVLVYGKQGIGKSHLIGSLLAREGYKGVGLLNTKYTVEEKGGASAMFGRQCKTLRRLLAHCPGHALVVDGIDRFVDIKTVDIQEVLPSMVQTTEFWSVEDIASLPAAALLRFDAILAVEEFPIAQRIALSKKMFPEPNVATRVAQSVKTPLELRKVAQWCQRTQDHSWSNIACILASYAKARHLAENKDARAMEPVQILGDMPVIAGYPALQEMMNKILHLFQKPDDYLRLGAKPPKGVLLIGPPGTGKTHFARHLSRSINIDLFAPDSSELAQDPTRISQVFAQARRHAPCIVFIDEIDILINTPEKSEFSGPDLAQQKITNVFLTELDGLESNEGVLVVGATHRHRYIDPAARRRLHDIVHLAPPDLEGRRAIWESHLAKRALEDDVCAQSLALATHGFTGADIAQALNLGAGLAAKASASLIGMEYLLKACDTVHWGHPDGVRCMAADDRRRVAIHEAGHALMAWRNGMDVPRITILPRAKFLGAVQASEPEGTVLSSRESVQQHLGLCLGGLGAEKVVYGAYNTGGVGDLENAQNIMKHALYRAGLGKSGPIAERKREDMSEKRKYQLEQEEAQWMAQAFADTLAWLESKKELLQELGALLLDKVEVSGQELELFAQRAKAGPAKT